MRKLFLLISILTLSMMANAATININTETADALRLALNSANDGDEIVMAAGTYVESNGGYIAFTGKHVTVKAAEGENVIIQPKVPVTIAEGGCAHFENVKFDVSKLKELADWYEHLIYPTDANTGNSMILDGCEIYGFTLNKSLLFCGSAYRLASVTINNCYFHNIMKSCLFIESTEAINISISNSTFANIETTTGDYYAGVIDSRATSGSFSVDHCTFYNVQAMSTDYAAIGKVATPGAVVSNCIFAMPESTAELRAVRDVATANNCLTFNYTKDSGKGIHGDVTQNNCIFANPLFKDAANGDFTLNNASPARGKGTSSTDLGDPRWAKAISTITIPATLQPVDATMSDSAGVVLGTPDVIDFKVIGSHKFNNTEWAKWKIHGNDGYYVFTINGNNLVNANTQQYVIKIYEPDDEEHPVLNETSTSSSASGAYTYTTGVVQLEDKDYIVKVTSPVAWSEGDIVSIVASYGGGNVVNISSSTNTTLNVADALYPSGYTRADGQISPNSSWSSAGYAKWNVATDETSFYNITLNFSSDNAHNMSVSIYEDENATPVASIGEGGYNETTGTQTLTDRVYLAGGKNYVVKVTNATDGSKAKITSVVFAPVATPVTALPGTLDPSDAILSPLAYVSGDQLYFVHEGEEGHITEQWAQWKVSVSAAQNYLFTMEVTSTNEQSYRITIVDSGDNTVAVYDKNPGSGGKTLTHYFYLTAGTYFVKVENTYNWSNGHMVSLAVSNPPEGMITLDEAGEPETVNGIISDNKNQAGKPIQLIRTIKAGMYNTICLPFDVSSSQCKEIFGNDVQLRTLGSADIEEGGFVLNLNFNSASDIYRGTPYLIKTTRDIVNPVFTGVEIKTTDPDGTYKANANFVGNFVKGTIPADENNLFLGANNTLYFPTTATEIKGMRAYFIIHDAPAGAIKRARIVEGSQVATDIELVESQEPQAKSQKMIVNGQLYIMYEGQMYNVQGLRIK